MTTKTRTSTRKPRPCPVCVHPHRAGIDDDLADGQEPAVVAKVHGLTLYSVRVHRKRHLTGEHAERFALYRQSLTWTMKDQKNLEALMRRTDRQLASLAPDNPAHAIVGGIQQSLERNGALDRMREAAKMNEARRLGLPRDHAKNVSTPPPADTGRCERSQAKTARTRPPADVTDEGTTNGLE